METEFAGCLMMIGPPDVIGMAGAVTPRPGRHLEQRGQSWADGAPVSSIDYMRRCEVYYHDHVVQAKRMPVNKPGLTSDFIDWWAAYKYWLMENRRGN